MSSGLNLGKTVTQTAIRWWQTRCRQADSQQPPRDLPDRGLAEAVLSRANGVSARDQVHSDMLRMMRHFSVDPAQVPRRFWGVLRDAEGICAHCLVVGRCQRWFHGRASDDAAQLFCPNAELYEEIAASQQQASDSDEAPTTKDARSASP